MKNFRLIRSKAASAAYNMELDEKIFSRYLQDNIGVFRIYSWQSPSFTYGFSQNAQEEIDLPRYAVKGVQVVKRMTGGGILFHDNEITYSFACGKDDLGEPEGVFVSYRNVCQFLMRFYKSLGLIPEFALQEKNFKKRSFAHQLCSASREKYDIVIGGRKIGGNAQKRKRQAIFQHGSIPLSIDWNFARGYVKSLPPDIQSSVTSLQEELKEITPRGILEKKLIDSFAETFGINFIEEEEFIYETCLAQ